MIKRCKCDNEGQDKLHGKGMRVMNPCKSKAGGNLVRCTVCLSEYDAGERT